MILITILMFFFDKIVDIVYELDNEFDYDFDYDFAGQSTLKALPTSWFERLRNFRKGQKSPSTFKAFLLHVSTYFKGGVGMLQEARMHARQSRD